MSTPRAKTTEPPATEPAPANNQPVHVVRLRNIRAAIWRNDTEFGTRHNVTVSRLYKDDQQQWRTTDSFGRDDLLLLAKVIDHAHTWICQQVQSQEVPF
jgi:hypothetical protein